ncbi:hypothetical protein [Turneriella parva]|uniref:SseB protein N-terminal domain-containing protein n=1 Tax=Turneriella parva (strain ATCC BAA-1111 / DSM 21527 / NCTC 11395 / H) TaxID=869212 RepID=I4B4J6_TURPD|nr:hypothetical protein [Turneriella parva]AFM12203.1 hypothetical protein Turpa_1555 [Turneriella parva DSM 21527]
MDQPDFIVLARDTFNEDGTVNIENGDKLWSALFKLPEWNFLMTMTSFVNKSPSAQMIDGKVWYLVFTDTEKLQAYATRNQNLDPDGKALFITMTPEAAVRFAQGSLGTTVYGFRFNEAAEHGWFSPLENLVKFPDYLREKGLL